GALGTMTFFEPVRSVAVLVRQLRPFRAPLLATARWWVPLALLVWTAAATLGRSAVLRRADPSLHTALPRLAVVSFLRALAFLALLALWSGALLLAVRSTVTHRVYAGGEPNLVLLTAEAVGITFLAFMFWSMAVWALDLKPLRAMDRTPPMTAPQRSSLRSKLVETNLVLGIVRVILFVLSLTFSASPLPFQTQETQAYINVWWTGVAVFYLLGSDFFHVVRRVTYLRLLQSIAGEANAAPPRAS
ncbi:MAG TPA: hypothetical protein VKV02_04045, partial [Acidobacteriaceae bacterium]|nr:hypothetical protein [Acidobacteriaceae bacterium]